MVLEKYDPQLVGGGGGWSCILLLHPVPTYADAGADLCTLYHDLCTLCSQWLSPAATYGGRVSSSNVRTKTLLAPAVVSPIATCAGGVFLLTTGTDTELTLGQLALCGGGVHINI